MTTGEISVLSSLPGEHLIFEVVFHVHYCARSENLSFMHVSCSRFPHVSFVGMF